MPRKSAMNETVERLDPVTKAVAEAFVRILQRRTGRSYVIVPRAAEPGPTKSGPRGD